MNGCSVQGVAAYAPELLADPSWKAVVSLGGLLGDAAEPTGRLLPPRTRGRASLLTRTLVDVVDVAAAAAGVDLAATPVLVGSALGEMRTTASLLDQIWHEKAVSPARFQGSVHNVSGAHLSIATRHGGFTSALAAGTETVAMTLLEAMAWLRVHGGDVIVAVGDEAADTELHRGLDYGAVAAAWVLSAATNDRSLARLLPLEQAQAPVAADREADAEPLPPRVQRNPCATALTLTRRLVIGQRGACVLSGRAGVGAWLVSLEEVVRS